MFQGVVHASARRILADYARHLPQHIHVIGSGNFSIETIIRSNGFNGTITSCDVSLYSCALGAYLADSEMPISLNKTKFPELEGLVPFLSDSVGRAAAVSVALDAISFRRCDNAYKRRMYRAYLRQLIKLCELTCRKLQRKRKVIRLDQFYSCDGWQRITEIPSETDHAIISFPPTYSRGYERLYAQLHEVFHWNQPEYREMTCGVQFAKKITSRAGPWLIGAELPTSEFESIVGAPIAQASRGSSINISLYSNIPTLDARLIRRHINVKEPDWARLSESDEITTTSDLNIHSISKPCANYIRQVYASVDILQSESTVCFAVTVNGKLIGILMFAGEYRGHPPLPNLSAGESVYLMADLAVASERYRRLSKLVLMAALSRETQQELERRFVRRLSWVVTTAFSQHPESMKYRGVFRRFSRTRVSDQIYRLNYCSQMGEKSLKESVIQWTKKFQSK